MRIVRMVAGILAFIPLLAIVLHTLIRVVRRFHKFPIPESFAGAIDNPLRRRIQPPDEMAARHRLRTSMRVLEVGPGNGTYTLAAARHVGGEGCIVTVDIEPRMLQRVRSRIRAEGIGNIHAGAANAHRLPFEDESFDAVYAIAVIGEIPEASRAMREFHRVLRSGGTLAFSELLLDPDYPRAATLMRWADGTGFLLGQRLGNAFHYTLVLEKGRMTAARR